MKKIVNLSFKILICLVIILILSFIGICIYSLTFMRIPFNKEAITDNNLSIQVLNQQNLLINEPNTFNGTKINLEHIPTHTKQAFISIEDKAFYNHNGISVKRIGKAFFNNLKKLKLMEGASTISQQLIKNTHLTNEKTLSRKLNEISLALDLERNFTKDEILENYLNIIYFGSNCYGLENASEYYFSKSAKDLSISESAMLAGLIKSPNFYSPVKQYERCLIRRNVVLKEMKTDGYIPEDVYKLEKAKDLEIKINKTRKNKLNSYSQGAIDEAMQILKMPEKQIAIGGYKIYTYQNLDNQISIEKTIKEYNESLSENDFAYIDINPLNGGILGYIGKSDYKILEHKRQPGSTIKPILVYAPAVNEDIISPATLIFDEPISINGYEPKNIGDKYYGYISAREALSKSLNVSTVKIASYLGLDKIKNYANLLDIDLDTQDNNYALTLGGMTYGINLKKLVGGYISLANKGKHISPKFVHYITTKEGKIVYKNDEKAKNIFREDSSFLTTDMLKTCAMEGTARKLNVLPFDVSSKTGTVGTKKGNTDAYNISYTTQNVVGVWVGNMDNNLIDTAGGNLPTLLVRDYFEKIYSKKLPKSFEKPNSVEEINLDLNEYENNHNISIANSLTPEIYIKKELFSRFNPPKNIVSSEFNTLPANLTGCIKNNRAILVFDASNYLQYEVYKQKGEKSELIKSISGTKGEIIINDDINEREKINYYVITKLKNSNGIIINEEKSNTLTLYNKQNTVNKKEKWYI